MDIAVAVGLGAAYSAAFCLVFFALLIGGVLVAPDTMVGDYPPAIQERYGPKSARGRRVGAVLGPVVLVVFLAAIVAGALHLDGAGSGEAGFWDGFWFGVTFMVVAHLIDLVLVDWLLFCTIRPAFVVLPGTEDMPEYRDYAFHLKVLFPRPLPWPILLIPVLGLVVGTITALV